MARRFFEQCTSGVLQASILDCVSFDPFSF
jgi:hypothetical protein